MGPGVGKDLGWSKEGHLLFLEMLLLLRLFPKSTGQRELTADSSSSGGGRLGVGGEHQGAGRAGCRRGRREGLVSQAFARLLLLPTLPRLKTQQESGMQDSRLDAYLVSHTLLHTHTHTCAHKWSLTGHCTSAPWFSQTWSISWTDYPWG